MNKKGFTLIELMIVIIIISGLMYLVIPNITSTKSSLDSKTCNAYVELVNTQVEAYLVDHETNPASLKELVDGHYIKSETCPDGTEILYDEGIASLLVTTTTSEQTTE